MRTRRFAIAVFFLVASLLHAEDEPRARKDAIDGEGGSTRAEIPDLVRLDALSDKDKGVAFALLGPLRIERRGLFSVRAERLVLWLDPRAETRLLQLMRKAREPGGSFPVWALRGIYAEGGAAPAIFQTAGRIYRCSSFFYDFQNQNGIFLDSDVRLRMPGKHGRIGLPIALRAKQFIGRKGNITGNDVTLFSTPYHEATVKVNVRAVEFRDDKMSRAIGELVRVSKYPEGGTEPDPQKVEAAVEEVERMSGAEAGEKRLRTKGVALRFGNTSISPRLSRTWGGPMIYEFDIVGGGELNRGPRFGIGMNMRPDSGAEFRWVVGTGYYLNRGPFVDLETIYKSADGRFSGRTFGVYLNDHGDDFGIEPPSSNRWWYQNRYRWRFQPGWRLDMELTDISDPLFLRVYDEAEFKTGKDQETLLYLRRRGAVGYFTVLAKPNNIDFQETVEELPTVAAELPVLTILRIGGTPLQLAGQIQAGNFRFQSGVLTPPGTPEHRTSRLDVDPTVQIAFSAGPVRIVPFATFRYTGYEHALDGSDLHRFAGTGGVRLDTQLHRFVGAVRHLMNWSVTYTNLYEVSEQASLLFPMDSVDRITPYDELSVRWRNRWQRTTPVGFDTYLDIELLALWYPAGQQPLGLTGDGFLEWDARWQANERLRILSEGGIESEDGDILTASFEGRWQVAARRAYSLGYRHLNKDSDVLTGAARFQVQTRWYLVARSQWDLREEGALDQSVRIERWGHTMLYGVSLIFDPGSSREFRLGFSVDLLGSSRGRRAPTGDYMWRN
ncbi:MAG: LPS assembly protein LptD [Planctomycetota bacterium]